jgi:hypothetical protein
MYVPTGLDERLRERMLAAGPPSLLVLGGSAGGGKSALIRKLERALPAGTFTRVIEDATHAESPDQDQTRTLAEALDGFRSGVPASGERILIAANTGLLLRLERLFRASGERGLAELVSFLLHRLGVPAAPVVSAERSTELESAVLVVDLDQRPTSGASDRLLRRMLASLDPDDPGGVLAGAARCRTCNVRQFCAPRTNLKLLADAPVGAALDEAVEQIALLRGRDIAPRQLWDGVAELALGGITPPASGDPCDTIADLAAEDNKAAVWRSLLPCGPLSGQGATTALCRELGDLDPGYQPTLEAHNIIAAAGVDPADDAEQLLSALQRSESERPAVTTAAEALRSEDREFPQKEVARGLIRAHWLAGRLPLGSPVPQHFFSALQPDGDEAARKVIDLVGNGLVRAFGHHAEGADYLPTDGLAESLSSRVLAKADISSDRIDLRLALPLERNPEGSEIVGMRPLAGRLQIGEAELVLDFGLFILLEAAASGAIATSVDIERYHSLRHAAEMLGRHLASNRNTPLLVVTDGTATAYKVITARFRDREDLRVTKVG